MTLCVRMRERKKAPSKPKLGKNQAKLKLPRRKLSTTQKPKGVLHKYLTKTAVSRPNVTYSPQRVSKLNSRANSWLAKTSNGIEQHQKSPSKVRRDVTRDSSRSSDDRSRSETSSLADSIYGPNRRSQGRGERNTKKLQKQFEKVLPALIQGIANFVIHAHLKRRGTEE